MAFNALLNLSVNPFVSVWYGDEYICLMFNFLHIDLSAFPVNDVFDLVSDFKFCMVVTSTHLFSFSGKGP
ncbi:hypothetical protein AYI69_g3983 [Smittium culicis]|uniref:Uncharacterized protein n=1 Tax=Smittium culicis TaxID=133412 RepID=A0A1R1YIF7_9FUNG|nr:hypothetical protein AYI69_g3983 [Smittium culicis]